MATVTKTNKYNTFKNKVGSVTGKAKKKVRYVRPYTSDEKAVEEYFRKRAQPKRVTTFEKPFY